MRYILTSALFFLVFNVYSQKKIIDHTVYNDWITLSNSKVSNDGRFISYIKKPHRGDGYLYIYNVEAKSLDSIPRGEGAVFSAESNYLAFKITPGFDTLRNCKLEKVDKKKWPKDSLGVYFLANDSLVKYPKLKSFELSEESDWAVFMFDHNKEKESKKKKKHVCKKKKNEEEYDSDGNVIFVFHPNEKTVEFKDVNQFELSKNGSYLAYTTHKKVKSDSVQLYVRNQMDGTVQSVEGTYSTIDKMTFNEQGSLLAFLSSMDSTKHKNYSLKLYNPLATELTELAETTSSFMPEGKAVSIHFQPMFAKQQDILYFGIADIVREEPKDTLTDDEKVKLDLWHYEDKRLQPKQLLEKKKDEHKTDLFAFHLKKNSAVQLANDTLIIHPSDDLRGDYLIAQSREQYMASDNWSMPWKSDIYRVAVNTGEAVLIEQGSKFGVELAPSGKEYVTFDGDDQQYYSIQRINDSEYNEVCLTCEVKDVFWTRDINGQPREASPYGVIGWNEAEDKVFLQSRYGIWVYSYDNNELTNIAEHTAGANKRIQFEPMKWSSDSVYVDFDNLYVKGFDEQTKGNHFYKLEEHGDHIDIIETGYFDAEVSFMTRSKNKKQYLLRKRTYIDYPELYTFNGDLELLDVISNTNPQQEDYNWGTVELVKWTSYEGIELEGLLYKPEDFDESKSYPLMVYFYELYTDRLHSHYIPKPTASIIYPTEYNSAGYVVFMPDIRYTPGHPAKSAYDCIMSGTDHVLKLLPNIDSTRMALQGQSWGGYQTAQLVTMTKRYAAAMAGAPVSNMFSAYGGIRWGSGLNRQFQYEKTQSRIGATIWENPELYVENSPLFGVPNIETPLLIMHNDDDGAVPWYQGIEMFTAMKRLGKQAWLLNYNGDKHNLMQNANRMDLSIRMRQFFDHYLQNKPAPSWMKDGIPAIVKGKELRYEVEE